MHMRRISRGLAGLTLLGGLLAAHPATAEPEASSPGGGYRHYVALGDSYTAGPLVPLQLPGPLGCFRSSANYPSFLASYFRVDTFTDVSCSAARSEHMFTSQTANLPDGLPENHNAPQLLALTPQTDLVTLGIGGNDFGLFGEMIDQCSDLAAEHPDAEAPCRDHFTVDGVDTKLRDARAIRSNVEQVLAEIDERSPDATVVVVNYLHILPESGTCADVPFAEGDYVWGTSVHQALNSSLRQASQTFGAEYVDMYAASQGHDACAPAADRWVNGASISPEAMNFHPFRAGMQAIAQKTFTQLTGQPAPRALPSLQVIKRLPAVIDVDALLSYLASGGDVPEETLEQAEEQTGEPVVGARAGLVRPLLETALAPIVAAVKDTLAEAEALLGTR